MEENIKKNISMYIYAYIYLNVVVQKLAQPCKSTAHQLKKHSPLSMLKEPTEEPPVARSQTT